MCFIFFNNTATTEIYTLSLHDALPISTRSRSCFEPRSDTCHDLSRGRTRSQRWRLPTLGLPHPPPHQPRGDRKSTRLNSSHANISYAVFCLKKKNDQIKLEQQRGTSRN